MLPLQGVARGNSRQSIRGRLSIEIMERAREGEGGLHNLLGLLVLCLLQVSVREVVEGVRVMKRDGAIDPVLPSRGGRAPVPVDRFLPKTQAGEDVCRHVKRMWNFGRHLAVVPCNFECSISQSGEVIRVNDVVVGARMVWDLCQDCLHDRSGLFLLLIGLVFGCRSSHVSQGIEGGGLQVVRKLAVDSFPSLFKARQPSPFVAF